jgi:hypothetical protein
MASRLLTHEDMPEPENESHAERKVVYETVTSSSTKNSAAAWIIIAVLAIALLAFILTRTF